jgi:drug/metabolite transporter (DMT)-like permease
VVFKEPLTRAKVLALALAVTGTVLTIGPGGSGQPLGIALGLLAAVIYAVYIVAGSTLTRHVTAIAASTVIMAAAAVVFGALVLARGLHLPSTWGGWSAVIAIAVVSTIVALIAFFAGLERVGPTNAAMLSTLEPVTTVSLAAIVLGEAMQPLRLMGGVLILGAVLVIVRYGDRPQSEVGRTERRTA